jgi:aspartate aminotransferase
MPDSPFRSAARLAAIGVSEIIARAGQAAALQRQGRDMIIFGMGEPDFPTPPHVCAAAAAAMAAGETRYTALDGSPAMKAAVQAKFARDNGLHFAPAQITVAAGAKQVLYNAMMATLDPGDEVIVPTPCWTTYVDIVAICGGTAVPVPTGADHGFLLTPRALEQAITPRTRWLMLNSPSNPSGAAYDAAALERLGEVLARHPQVWIICDDIYEHILFDGRRFATLAAVRPDLAARILTVNGVSKAYAMTGWRVGYGAGPAPLIAAMAVVQSQSTSCPSSISQAAAIAALTGPQDALAVMRDAFQSRRDVMVERLRAIDGLTCLRPQGAFYAYVGCAGLIGRRRPDGTPIAGDRDLADHLLDHGVAVVPGACFGLSPYFRLSYACSTEDLVEGIGRIAQGVAVLA